LLRWDPKSRITSTQSVDFLSEILKLLPINCLTNGHQFYRLGTEGGQCANSTSGYSFEEGTFTASFTAATTSTQTIKFTRCGNRVTLQVPAFNGAFGSSGAITAEKTIPVRLRPTTGDAVIAAIIMNDGSTQVVPGWIVARTNGNLDIYNSGGTNFDGGNVGISFVHSVTYLL